MHKRRASLGGLRNEYVRGPLRYRPSGMREQVAQTDGVPNSVVLGGVKKQAWEAFVIEQCASQ